MKQPCGGAVSAFSSLWVAIAVTARSARLDRQTFKVTKTLTTGAGLRAPASPQRPIASGCSPIRMARSPASIRCRTRWSRNSACLPRLHSLAFGETALWLACPAENRVLRIDPQSNLVESRSTVSAGPRRSAIGESSVWVLCGKGRQGRTHRPEDQQSHQNHRTRRTRRGGDDGIRRRVAVGEHDRPSRHANRSAGEKVVQQFYGGRRQSSDRAGLGLAGGFGEQSGALDRGGSPRHWRSRRKDSRMTNTNSYDNWTVARRHAAADGRSDRTPRAPPTEKKERPKRPPRPESARRSEARDERDLPASVFPIPGRRIGR